MGKHVFLWSAIYFLNLILLPQTEGAEVGILIFADGVSVHRALLDGTQHHVLPLSNIRKAKFLEFDPQTKQIYWADIGSMEIWRTDLCGEEQQRVYSPNATSSTYFISLALDYEARKIYWTNTGNDIIERVNLNGNEHMEIASEGISSPKDLELDINNGYLYWLDGGTRPKIERCKMDGSARETVFDLKRDFPSALALDVDRQKLYWNNGNDQSIWVGSVDGSMKRQFAPKSVHPFPNMIGMSILDDYLYWENFYNKRIERMKITSTPVTVHTVVKNISEVLEVKAVKVTASDIQCSPGAPTNIRIMDVTNTSVKVTWIAGYNWGTSQSFQLFKNTSDGWSSLGVKIPSINQPAYSYTVTGLTPNQGYQVKVKACNPAKRCNKDKFDVVRGFKTKGYPATLVSPSIDRVTNITASLRYRLPDFKQADLSSLVLLARKLNGEWRSLTTFEKRMSSDLGDIYVEVLQLQPRMEYEFLVRPCNIYGCNPRNPKMLRVTTLGYPDLPEDSLVSKITNSSAELRFNVDFVNTQLQPEVIINIQRERDTWPLKVRYKISTKGEQKRDIESLNPKTAYMMTLRICNVYGCNPQQTKPVRFVTRGKPSRPSVFKVTNKTSASVTLAWRVAFHKEDQFHAYSLQMSINKGNWTVIQTVTTYSGGGLITYTHDDLMDHNEYSFRLSICNIFGCSTDPEQIVTVYNDGEEKEVVDEDKGSSITPRERLIIIIVAVVIGVFIIVVLLICVVKCAMRNALSKDDYLNVKYSGKPTHI
ncbi:uncharacterized protein LOC125646508 isoform X1 [Ostrea edulis]|uniref:uncharacterized protein LOC125646508 isoform X1 n=1 Tax=Ostrea edulis TaxID=37623 RepID=UPI0024AFEACE|nr:uncharacterized protein LOC125646508 isoform X1 [Ostrea edulis]